MLMFNEPRGHVLRSSLSRQDFSGLLETFTRIQLEKRKPIHLMELLFL